MIHWQTCEDRGFDHMLADGMAIGRLGALNGEAHRSGTFFRELLDFIADGLRRWRDRGDRTPETSETVLTSQLCAHLNSTARLSTGWDILQFRTEVPDEGERARRIDLVAAPAGTKLCVEGRSYTDFDTLLPIECKRLPTPTQSGRDAREYVFSGYGSRGGIQRFKAGFHGAAHTNGAMIGFLQSDTVDFWRTMVTAWIRGLAGSVAGWSDGDLLSLEVDDITVGIGRLRSRHDRARGLGEIELCHLWIVML